MKVNRRRFIMMAGLGGAAAATGMLRSLDFTRETTPGKSAALDFHVHLFGAGDAPGLAPNECCFLSPTQRRHWTYPYLRRLLRLPPDQPMDQAYVEQLVRQVTSSSLNQVVLLAQDGRYNERGRLDLERTTSIYVPNRYLFKVVAEHPRLFLACPSINPKRRDALDELEFCFAQGARVLKVHPPTQDVDPADARFQPFFRRCAELRMVVMVHTGMEHSADIVGNDYADPRRLARVLEEGCRVVACHSGMGAFFDREDFFPHLVAMMRRHSSLYCDTAVLASMFRWRNLPRILREPLVLSRTLHASDFPFPSNALVFWNRLPISTTSRLVGESSLLERDLQLKQALGLPAEVFSRGYELLGLRPSPDA